MKLFTKLFQKKNIHRYYLTYVETGRKDMLMTAMSMIFQAPAEAVMHWPIDDKSRFAFEVLDHHPLALGKLRQQYGPWTDFDRSGMYEAELLLIRESASNTMSDVRDHWRRLGKELPDAQFQNRVWLVFQKYIRWLRPYENYNSEKHSQLVNTMNRKYFGDLYN